MEPVVDLEKVLLINAPQNDKLTQDTTIQISHKPAGDLDDQVISELEKFGMTKDEVVRLVLTKTHSSLATLYYLLLDTLVGKRKAANKRNMAMGNGVGNVITGPQAIHLNSSGGGTSGGHQRPKSASATGSSGHHGGGMMTSGGLALTAAGGQGVLKVAPQLYNGHNQQPITTIQQQQMELQNQQAMTEQQNALQAQQAIDRQEYRYRPKSAAMNRTGSSGPQRPSSAFATRR
eukprot:gene34351-42364_t